VTVWRRGRRAAKHLSVKAHWFIVGAVLLTPLGAPLSAGAQVVVNPLALQQLAGIAPPPAVVVMPVVKPAPHRVHHASTPERLLYTPPPLKPAPLPAPTPVVAKPVLPAPAKPLGAVEVDFAPGSATLPAASAAALKPWCASSGRIDIAAHAPVDPADPSSAMRLSLARALAVRDALLACGVPGTSILPRALGAGNDDAVIGSAP